MNFKSPEFTRKLVHLTSLIIPIIYYFVSKNTAIIALSILFITFAIWDIIRLKNSCAIISYCNKTFMRDKEKNKLSGAFYFTLACLLGVIFFSKYVFILSVTILVICDTIAALVGINWGKHKIYNKSLEGSIAFFIAGLIVIAVVNLIFNLPLINLTLLISLLITTLAELLSSKLRADDNLLIVLVFGVSYYLLG